MHNDAQQQQTRLETQETIARRLRALPDETLQPYDWEEFRRRADRETASLFTGTVGTGAARKFAAIAAAVLVLATGIAVWSHLSASRAVSESVPFASDEPGAWQRPGGVHLSGSSDDSTDDPQPTAGTGTEPGNASPAGTNAEIRNDRTKAAERWLASLPQEPAVVRVGTRAAVAGLEDRIAQLDDVLSTARLEGAQPAHLTALQEQRAQLVNSLVQVRYAEALVYESR